MPVKPENKARYPSGWGEIAAAVKADAKWCCEQCGVFHGDVIWRGTAADGRKVFKAMGASQFCPPICAETGKSVPDLFWDDVAAAPKPTRIIITVAHLDHQPENVERGNLRALCQRCHLAYDFRHHAANAAKTRHRGRAVRDFFEEPP